MYLEEIPQNAFTTTMLKIRYDCCEKEHTLKYKDAKENFVKNNGKHICRSCWLKSSANPAKQKISRDKIKQTNLERYGTAVPMNTKEAIEKRRDKFKDEEWKEQWVEKHKQTSMEKYGVAMISPGDER